MNTPNMLRLQENPTFLTKFQKYTDSEVLRDISNIEKGFVSASQPETSVHNEHRVLLKDFQVKLAKRLAVNNGEFKPENLRWFDN
ncbi:unnamed protein product [Blepharisma stoltei]|uniref:Uncharacterized protein n=1 Tax=Blepharisma stoltei TaxID=1481888 RepID=A0AAU9KFU5_9CILI|nr:unnamed protein product [Blepharisma stoltei]